MRRTLLTLIVAMGVMILAGTVALVWGLVSQAGKIAPQVDVANTVRVGLGLPKGTKVRSVSSGDARVVLHVTLPDGTDVIYVVPLRGGVPLRIDLGGAVRGEPK